jgi:acetyl-CoA carboxylase carboxyl transferase alpha subunit
MDLIGRMTTGFMPLRGDRAGEDDPALVAGFASLAGEAVLVIGQERPPHSGQSQNWLGPGAFRKAKRALDLASKFNLPVVTLIDTTGASPDLEAEEQGLGYAVATCLGALLNTPVPTIAAIIGEGNSEGAVALGAADRVLMLDNAVYEVIRPEDAARILYQQPDKAGEVAERLRITSHDCLRLGIVDRTVAEPAEGAHTNHQEAALLLRRAIMRELTRLQSMRQKSRLEQRYERYRQVGSTRSSLRGTMERRLAHGGDRLWSAWDRFRGTSDVRRRPGGGGDAGDIPV